MTTEGSREILVRAGGESRSYTIYFVRGVRERLPQMLVQHAPAHRYVLICDTNVDELYGDGVGASLVDAGLNVSRLTFPAGEAAKDRSTWAHLTDRLAELGCGRDTALVGLGGGVTTDLAGFVAATFMRGVGLVQVPTTILAMVDAAIGGKVGVNLAAGKNMIGSFHPPSMIVVDPAFTSTLPRPIRAEGWVEALKHGVIRDRGHFKGLVEQAPALLEGDVAATAVMVEASAAIKGQIVSVDELDRGTRQLLNFGHTVGHALERVTDWSVSHGRAVAIGMCVEARAGEMLGVTAPGTSEEIRTALERFEVDVAMPDVDPAAISRSVRGDKKSREGHPRYVVIAGIGHALPDPWLRELPDELLEETIAWHAAEAGRAVAGRWSGRL